MILESFWATDEALRASERAVAPGRGEAALLGGGTVTVERYRLPVFEQDVPGRGGEGVRLTRMDAEPDRGGRRDRGVRGHLRAVAG